jgi:hypothetical protein
MTSTVAAAWWSQHGTHTLTIAGPILVFAFVGLGADLRAWMRRRQPGSGPPLAHIAALLSVAAGAIHLGVLPHHVQAGWLYGAFFAVSGITQLLWAAGAWVRPPAWWMAIGLLENAAIALLWLVTRTLGVPLGPSAGALDPVGVLDVTCTVAEVGIVAICAVMVARQQRHRVPASDPLGSRQMTGWAS